jgi:hypothetical protein
VHWALFAAFTYRLGDAKGVRMRSKPSQCAHIGAWIVRMRGKAEKCVSLVVVGDQAVTGPSWLSAAKACLRMKR